MAIAKALLASILLLPQSLGQSLPFTSLISFGGRIFCPAFPLLLCLISFILASYTDNGHDRPANLSGSRTAFPYFNGSYSNGLIFNQYLADSERLNVPLVAYGTGGAWIAPDLPVCFYTLFAVLCLMIVTAVLYGRPRNRLYFTTSRSTSERAD